MSRLAFALSLFALATLPFVLGCSSGTCVAIPDGVYTAIGPDGEPLVSAAVVVPILGDAASDAAHDAAAGDASAHDASARDAATQPDAGRDAATAHDAAIIRDGGGTAHDAATLLDAAAHDAATARDAADPADAAATDDAAIPVDAGTTEDAGGTVPVTYTFHGGLPAPYDTWECIRAALTCEMTYICNTPGEPTVSIVTSYITGPHASLAFSVTPPGTIVHLQPTPQ